MNQLFINFEMIKYFFQTICYFFSSYIGYLIYYSKGLQKGLEDFQEAINEQVEEVYILNNFIYNSLKIIYL